MRLEDLAERFGQGSTIRRPGRPGKRQETPQDG